MGGVVEKAKEIVKKVGKALQKAFYWLTNDVKNDVEEKVNDYLDQNKEKINKANNRVETCKVIVKIKSIDELKKQALEQKKQLSLGDQKIVDDIFDDEVKNQINQINQNYNYNYKRNRLQENYDEFNNDIYIYKNQRNKLYDNYNDEIYNNKINHIYKYKNNNLYANYDNDIFLQRKIQINQNNEENIKYTKQIIDELKIFINNYKRRYNYNVHYYSYLNQNNYEKELIINKLKKFSEYCYYHYFKNENIEQILQYIDYLAQNFRKLKENSYINYINEIYYLLNKLIKNDDFNNNKYFKKNNYYYHRKIYNNYDEYEYEYDDFK